MGCGASQDRSSEPVHQKQQANQTSHSESPQSTAVAPPPREEQRRKSAEGSGDTPQPNPNGSAPAKQATPPPQQTAIVIIEAEPAGSPSETQPLGQRRSDPTHQGARTPHTQSDDESDDTPKGFRLGGGQFKYRKSFAHSSFAAIRSATSRLRLGRWKHEEKEVLGVGAVGTTCIGVVRFQDVETPSTNTNTPSPQVHALQPMHSECVVVKRILKSFTQLPGWAHCQLQLSKLQGISHTNLAHVLTSKDSALVEGEWEVSTEYFDDGSLEAEIGSGNEPFVLQVLVDLAKGLRHLHTNGLCHLNIKPQNVFRSEMKFCLSDCGYAPVFEHLPPQKLFDDFPQCRTSAHFPPEYIREGQFCPEYREAADMWALGVLAYQLLTGRDPFDVRANQDYESFVGAILNGSPQRIDFQIEPLVQGLLVKDPEERMSIIELITNPIAKRMKETLGLKSVGSMSIPSCSSWSSAVGGRPLMNARQSLAVGFIDTVASSQSLTGEEDGAEPARSAPLPQSRSRRLTISVNNSAIPEASVDVAFLSVSVKCTLCHDNVRPLAFRCMNCSEYILCSMCYLKSDTHSSHPPNHVFQSYVVDEMVPSQVENCFGFGEMLQDENSMVPDSPFVNSFEASPGQSRRETKSTVMLSSKLLNDEEKAVVSMSGRLPTARLAFSRRRSSALVELSTGDRPEKDREQSGSTKSLQLSSANESNVSVFPVPTQQDSQPRKKKVRIFTSEEAVPQTVDEIVDDCQRNKIPDLILAGKNLSTFPIQVSSIWPELNHLTLLDLAKNGLDAIPTEISSLTSLRKLYLGDNCLTILPDTLGDLPQLELLDLNHNQLNDLPVTFMFADSLATITMDYNLCEGFPEVIFEMASLTSFYIAANPKICGWPDLRVLASNIHLTIGVDNEPRLVREYEQHIAKLADIKVQWNKVFPDLIYPNLYCGSVRSAQTPHVYESLNITSVLTVGRGLQPNVLPSMSHRTVIVDDIDGATIDTAFEESADFIDAALNRNEGCLVHCFAGMSRSATTIIAYLMMRRGMRLDEAYLLTKKGRPAIYPNQGFYQQLQALDKKLNPDGRPLDLDSLHREIIP
jgi:protein-tyrosine phosphatase